jgi:hypothetical protein
LKPWKTKPIRSRRRSAVSSAVGTPWWMFGVAAQQPVGRRPPAPEPGRRAVQARVAWPERNGPITCRTRPRAGSRGPTPSTARQPPSGPRRRRSRLIGSSAQPSENGCGKVRWRVPGKRPVVMGTHPDRPSGGFPEHIRPHHPNRGLSGVRPSPYRRQKAHLQARPGARPCRKEPSANPRGARPGFRAASPVDDEPTCRRCAAPGTAG